MCTLLKHPESESELISALCMYTNEMIISLICKGEVMPPFYFLYFFSTKTLKN